MERHYSTVILAHDALLKGDLEAFRSQLARVPEQGLPDGAPPAWTPLHDRLLSAARDAASASDLEQAASGLASVALACGTCHQALETSPLYPAPAPDDGANALQAAMMDHKWAAERLWEGVTGPWDNAWERGAEALASGDVFGDLGPEVILSDALRQRGQALRDLGEAAERADTLDARARVYGRLLATCGDCHRAIGAPFEAPR
jgi:cytochrome c553